MNKRGLLGSLSLFSVLILSIIICLVIVLPAFADVNPGGLQGYDFCGGNPCPTWVNLSRGDMFFADGNDVYIIANISCSSPHVCNSSMLVDANFSQIGGNELMPGVFKQNGTDASWAIFEFNDTVNFTTLSVQQIQPKNITMNATVINDTSGLNETFDLPGFFAVALLVNMSTFGCPPEGQPGASFPEVPGWNESNSSPVLSPVQAVGCTQNVSLCSYTDTYGPGTWNGTHWMVCAPSFGGATTNFTDIAESGNFSAIQNFTIDVPGKAKIVFQTNISFDSQQQSQAIMEFAMKSVMGAGRVGINDTEFCGDSCGQPDRPNLNLSARLTIYNISGQLGISGKPQIIRTGYDGSNPQSCLPSICSDVVWDGENLTFTVSSFSSYTATDAINVSLVSPGDNNWSSVKTINFTYNPVWNSSVTMDNCTLYGNFTGSWLENVSNTTPLVNGSANFITNTVPTDEAYIWNVECYDNTGLGDAGTANYTVKVDSTAPGWYNNVTTPQSSYSASSPSLFNVTWNDTNSDISNVLITIRNSTAVLISNASMTNDTFNGSIYNYSLVLPAGTFNWTSYANDSAGNWDDTDTWSFTIGQADNQINLYLNNSTEYANQNIVVVYGTQTNATGVCSAGTCNIYRNDSDVSSENDTQITLGTGSWEYTVNTTGNQNYSANSTTYYVIVNQAPVILQLSNNLSWSGTYPEGSNTTGTGCPAQITCNLYRNSTAVSNPGLALLGVGAYNYTYNTSGNANYSSNTTANILAMAQGTPDVQIFIGGDGANSTITYSTSANISGNSTTTVTPPDFSLYVVNVSESSPAIALSNTSNNPASLELVLGNGTYQVIYNTSGNANWSTASNSSIHMFVNKASNPVSLILNDSADQNVTYTYPEAVNATVTTNIGTVYLYRNDSLVANGTSPQSELVLLGNDTHPYKVNATGNANYSDNSTGVTFYALVNKGVNLVNLYLNGSTNQNVTYTYPESINSTGTSSGGTVFLYRNGTHVANGTSPQAENIRLGNDTFPYKVNVTGDANWSDNATGVTFYALVNKGVLSLLINFSPSSTVTFGNQTTANATESNVGDDGVVYELRRDGALADNTTPYSEVATLAVGTYNYTFNATGGNNWTANTTGISSILTVQTAPAASFVPTGGGGPVPVVIDVDRKKGNANVSIGSISAGGTTNVSIAKIEDMAVRKISISVRNSANDIQIRITKIAGAPASVSHEIEGKVYHYINIEKENIQDADINRTVIRFAVNKTWMEENGINYSDISLYRWESDRWNELPTTYVSNDSFEHFYEAVSPGFSTFVIGTSGGSVEPELTVVCAEAWSCTDWSECANDLQTRTCTDTNACGTTDSKPVENQPCEIIAAVVTDFPIFEVTIVAVLIVLLLIFVLLEVTGHINLGILKELFKRNKTKKTSLYENMYDIEEELEEQ
ncbi:MAG: PGF-pre-PGF domain-containing protein [Candidatus Aenigmatarchaeota archaeon]